MTTEYKSGITIQNIEPPLALKDYKLIAFDMDSTILDMETIDDIAEAVGKRDQVAAITQASMRGEIKDFKDSLRRRVALLKGVPASVIDDLIADMQLNPGAETLIRTLKNAGYKTMLLSGGFTVFTNVLKKRFDFDYTRSNVLEIKEGVLTGELIPQPWGDICDGEEKKRCLLNACDELNIKPSQAIAMGDGSNDIPMMSVAGLSVAYHAKPIVQAQAKIAINEGGLDRLLEVLLPSG